MNCDAMLRVLQSYFRWCNRRRRQAGVEIRPRNNVGFGEALCFFAKMAPFRSTRTVRYARPCVECPLSTNLKVRNGSISASQMGDSDRPQAVLEAAMIPREARCAQTMACVRATLAEPWSYCDINTRDTGKPPPAIEVTKGGVPRESICIT